MERDGSRGWLRPSGRDFHCAKPVGAGLPFPPLISRRLKGCRPMTPASAAEPLARQHHPGLSRELGFGRRHDCLTSILASAAQIAAFPRILERPESTVSTRRSERADPVDPKWSRRPEIGGQFLHPGRPSLDPAGMKRICLLSPRPCFVARTVWPRIERPQAHSGSNLRQWPAPPPDPPPFPQRAVRASSRSQWNGGFSADCSRFRDQLH
jgi:hypothetical protein